MTEIHVIITSPEEAYDNEAEFWCAHQLMGTTVLHERTPSPPHRRTRRRLAVAGGHHQPGASAGRGRRAPRCLLI
jgi:hypothetical protein